MRIKQIFDAGWIRISAIPTKRFSAGGETHSVFCWWGSVARYDEYSIVD